jgi:hypothetical protein
MSKEYTPTTEEVRNWATYVPNGTIGMHISERDAAAFDRWLAEVKAEAWDQGGVAGYDAGRGLPSAVNPYREEAE